MGFEPGKPTNIRAKRQPTRLTRPTPDQADRERPAPRPAPAPRPTGVFAGVKPATQPIVAAQHQAAQRSAQARAKLPPVPIAAPPIIHNPTPAQVHAATRQIAVSINTAIGTGGTGAQRNARRDAILTDIRTQPRYASVRASLQHWSREQAKLITPEARQRMVTDTVKPGRPPRRLHAGLGPVEASINLTAATRGAGSLLAKVAPGLVAKTPESQILRNALGDVAGLAYGPFVGALEGASAQSHDIVSALRGHPGDLVHGHEAALLKAVAGQYAHEIAHPEQAFRAHPVNTILDAAGAVSAAGRVAGAAARGAGKAGATGIRGALAEHSHVVRPPIALVDDSGQPVLVERTYSKDLTRRAAQVAADRGREPVRDAHGNTVTVEDRGRTVPVLKATPAEREREFKRRGDFTASRTNSQERIVREQAAKASRVIGVKGKAARAIVSMTVEGTLTSAQHFAADLAKERQRLADRIDAHENGTQPFNDSRDLAAAQARLKLVDGVLGSPKAMAQGPRIIAEAERHGLLLNEGDKAAAAAEIGNEHVLRRAALSVTALTHMGARHYTVEEHQALERQAAQAEKQAVEAYDQAKTPAARQAALQVVQAARQHRIEVSGREPTGYAAHEQARANVAAAEARAKTAHEREEKVTQRIRALTARHASERGREAHHGPVAAYYVGNQRFTLRQDALAAAKAAGLKPRDIRRVATTAGEAKRVGEISQARRLLARAKAERRAADKAVASARKTLKSSPLPETRAALRYGENNPLGKTPGSFLPNKDIEDFLRSRGRNPDTVAYLPHRYDVRGQRAHHTQFRPGTRPLLDNGETRTGSAYLAGVTESSERLLHDQGVRQAVQINKARAIDKLVAENGLRHPAWAKAAQGAALTAGEQRIVDRGGLFTGPEGLDVARRLENDTGQRFTPMRSYQGSLDEDTKRIIRDDLQAPGAMETLSGRLLNSRIVQPAEKIDARTRNVVLVPSELVERLEAHLRPAGPVERFFQFLNRPFRMAVLPTPRWLTGNFAEAYLVRLPTVGSGVNVFGLAADVRAASRAIKTLEGGTPEMRAAAEEIKAQLGQGLFVGGRGATVRRTAEEAMPQFAQRRYGQIVQRLPVVAHMAEMTKTAVHWLAAPLQAFFIVNRDLIENPANRASFGHTFRRDMQALTGSWMKSVISTRQAVYDAARGYVNTPAQQRATHDLYQLLGKYAGYSPTLRALVQSVAPFLPWALNAARFVFWTMPAHNTVKTALLLKVNQVVQKDWEEIHKSVPPGSLKDAIPNGHGGWIDLARYTPFGLTEPIARGEDLRSITQEFTPQFGGATNALQGKDPFGRDLEVQPSPAHPDGKPSVSQEFLLGGYDLLESLTPYLATGRRLREHGETAYADSTILSPKTKPGSSHGMSAANRTFNPLRPTYVGAPPSREQNVTTPTAPAPPQSLEDRLRSKLVVRQAGPSDLEQRLRAKLNQR